MNQAFAIDLEALLREIARYLAAVELYRAEGCEPTWLPEAIRYATVPDCIPARAENARLAH